MARARSVTSQALPTTWSGETLEVRKSADGRIRKTVDLIAAFSGSGRALEQRPAVRVMPIGRYPYLIFYAMSADEVVILHIRHSAQAPVDPSEL